MKKLLLVSSIMLFVFGTFGFGMADVLDFEDLSPNSPQWIINFNYGGFAWDTWGIIVDSTYQNIFGNSYGSPSGEWAAYNADGLQVSVSSTGLIDFHGAYFSSWAFNDSNMNPQSSESVTVEGYRNSQLVKTATLSLSYDHYDWLQADINGVDQLVFLPSSTGTWFLMDDFTFKAAPVPEPSTMLLFGAGLVGFAGFRKKFMKT